MGLCARGRRGTPAPGGERGVRRSGILGPKNGRAAGWRHLAARHENESPRFFRTGTCYRCLSDDTQDVTARGIHAIKPEGSTASTVFSLGLSGSRGHADEARGQTRLKPGLSQGQVTTATPVRLDFRRTKILDEGCAGAMPTDSPCSVARDTASDQGCAATGSAMPSGSAFNMGCFGVVHDKLGRSIDGSLFATAPFSGNSIMSRFLCGKH